MIRLKLKKISKVKLLIVSTLLLVFGASAFSLIRMYAVSIQNTFTSSSITDTTVYVNDLDTDWNYYMGLNFSEVNSADENAPTGENKGLYTENNLVPVTLTYSGVDINDSSVVGRVSPTEGQYIYEYYKYYPLTTCDGGEVCIKIELLDAPFYNRPQGKGFHGWGINYITHDDNSNVDGAYITYDRSLHTRYLSIPITCSSKAGTSCSRFGTEHLNIYLNANWYDHKSYVIDNNHNYRNGTLTNRSTNTTINFANYLYGSSMVEITDVNSKYAVGSNMVGLYAYEPYDESKPYLYYTSDGTSCTTNSWTCGSWGSYYRIITPGSAGAILEEDSTFKYAIFPTRDMNFVVYNMSSNKINFANTINAIGSSVEYTFTSLITGTSISTSYAIASGNVNITTDMAIDNIYVSGATANASTSINNSGIRAQYHNFKIGRNFLPYAARGANANTGSAAGIFAGSTGSVSGNQKFKIIVESGTYGYAVHGHVSSNQNVYLNGKYIYGSDYDRVSGNNTKLVVRGVAAGQYYGIHNRTDDSSIITDVVYKSGTYGMAAASDNSSGVYVGGRSYGYVNGLNRAKFEGGVYSHIIGGPCVNAGETTTAIYFTGGTVDFIFGGAATSTTIGDRVVSVTGGTVNNNIFGGSNSFDGSQTEGRLTADTFIYVGGNAVVGNSNRGKYNATPGDVFGAGAGKSGENFRELGTVGSATIVIDGDAVINGSVYGGGNYGTTGRATADYSETTINLLGGTVKGNVFGSSNNNGSGRKEEIITAAFSKLNYYQVKGTVALGETIPHEISYYTYRGWRQGDYSCNGNGQLQTASTCSYSGSNGSYEYIGDYDVYLYDNSKVEAGTVCTEDSPSWNGSACIYASLAILAGENIDKYTDLLTSGYYQPFYIPDIKTIDFVDANWSKPNDVTTTFGDEAHKIIINQIGTTIHGSLYGGANSSGTVFANVDLNLLGGTINGSAFGGGLGSDTYVSGSINVNIDGINSPNTDVYGGSAYGFVGYSDESDAAATNPRTTKVTLNSGTVNDVYVGSMGSDGIMPLVNTYGIATVNGGNANCVYGGSNINAETTYRSIVNIKGGNINYVYGGSNRLGSILPTEVNLDGGYVNYLFGGSNVSGTTVNNNVKVISGTAVNVYGGNNAGGTAMETKVTLLGGNVTNVYGCGKGSGTSCITANVLIESIDDSASNIFGGGEEAYTETSKVLITGGSVGNIFGGNNKSGNAITTNVYLYGGHAANAYGGNNVNGETINANVFIGAGNFDNVYGGGFEATTINAVVEAIDGNVQAVYGGGNSASVENPVLNVHGGNLANVYGGSNSSGTITSSTVNVGTEYVHVPEVDESEDEESSEEEEEEEVDSSVLIDPEKKAIMDQIVFSYEIPENSRQFNQGWIQDGSGYPYVMQLSVSVTNPTNTAVYVPFKIVMRADTLFFINENTNNYSAMSWVKDDYGYYGANDWKNGWLGGVYTTEFYIPPGTNSLGNFYFSTLSANPEFTIGFDYQVDDSQFDDIINAGKDDVAFDDTDVNKKLFKKPTFEVGELGITNVYGGNNAGGLTNESNVYIYNDTDVSNVYGGGSNAATDYTHVNIFSGNIDNVYGGGEGTEALVNHNTDVIVRNGTIGNVYGGGNAGNVVGETLVSMLGGNVTGSVFGSGNAASTGLDGSSSLSTVNIYGSSIAGNVYGGANSSVVNGSAKVNIGSAVISDARFTDSDYSKDIYIGGTVFGGSESNAAGDENYDFSAISVTDGIYIKIDPTNYNSFKLLGSVFGSGNASDSKGDSIIRINNLGTKDEIVTLTSIQRADQVYLTNSFIQLEGTTDSTSSHSKIKYSFNIINHLYLLNNTELYLRANANLLENMSSGLWVDDDVELETVNIDSNGNVTQNVNNKLYILPSKALNVLKSQDVDENFAGNVNGMAFLGMYAYNYDSNTATLGIYDTSYKNGNVATTETIDVFRYSGTYVYGKHYEDHDITVDGFYTNSFDEDTNVITVDYVEPSPSDAKYYMWVVGIKVTSYEITLEASRYSTLGVKNLALTSFDNPDTKFRIEAFTYNDLKSGVSIIDSENVPKVADSSEDANTTFGLAVGNGTTGWKNNGMTELYSSNPTYSGTKEYTTDSTVSTPILSFYFHHSKNIELAEDEDERELGDVRLIITAIAPQIDEEVTSEVTTIEVVIHLLLTNYDEDGYGAAMSPGKKYAVFPSIKTNIAANSSLSLYHTLYMDLNKVDKYGEPWSVSKLYPTGAYRALASSTVYPVGTTITMIDLVDNEYYYYTVTSDNIGAKRTEYNNQGQVSYYLRDFIKMDSISTDNNFDDAEHNDNYYHSDGNYSFEEFIFTVDFAGASITSDMLEQSIYLELRDPNKNDAVIMRPLADTYKSLVYNVYANAQAEIVNTGSFSDDTVYVGELTTLDLSTVFNQDDGNSGIIYDTTFDDYKLGAKITVYDNNGIKQDGSSLLGLTFTLDGKEYYPQTDGTTRINLAGKVANVKSVITVDTSGSALSNGEYIFRIEAFGSYDGLYYSDMISVPLDLKLTLMNNMYGLDVSVPDDTVIHDKDDGLDMNGDRYIEYTIETTSGLDAPNLRVSLQRRKYESAYDMTYELVDLQEYVEETLTITNAAKDYLVTDTIPTDLNTITFGFTLKNAKLKTGTYRVKFSMYDGDNYIGSVYKYLIIRDM